MAFEEIGAVMEFRVSIKNSKFKILTCFLPFAEIFPSLNRFKHRESVCVCVCVCKRLFSSNYIYDVNWLLKGRRRNWSR